MREHESAIGTTSRWFQPDESRQKMAASVMYWSMAVVVPLSFIVSPANTHDCTRLSAVLQAIRIKRPTPPHWHSKHLRADAGYRNVECLPIIQAHGYISHVYPRRLNFAPPCRFKVDPRIKDSEF
jgi:hypothetical protein